MRRAFFVVLVVFGITLDARGAEYRAPRELVYAGTPVTVYVLREKRTEVVMPERITGILPPTRMSTPENESPTEGMEWNKGPNLDRLFFVPLVAGYKGTVTVHGDSGRSYILYLVEDQTPDVSVLIRDGKISQEQATEDEKKTPRHKLIEWLMRGETPPGYRKTIPSGPAQSRVVYRHGSIVLYVEEIYESVKQKGVVLIAENVGRTPVYFPVESIDFQSREAKQAFGIVREISMDTPHLGPHPEHASDVVSAPHQSFVYIVTRKTK